MDADRELLPCPFCGSPAVLMSGNSTLIRCASDQCISQPTPFNDYGHMESAITAWNTRARLAQPQPDAGRLAERIGSVFGENTNGTLTICGVKFIGLTAGQLVAALRAHAAGAPQDMVMVPRFPDKGLSQ